MKKIVKSYFLAAVLCVCAMVLFACSDNKEDIAGKVEQNQESVGADKGNTENEGQQDKTDSTQEDKNLSLGSIEGGTYTNEYLGIGCKLDENWTLFTAEELQELPQAVKDAMDGTDLGESMEGIEQIMDMKADNVEELTTINIVYAKVDLQERLYVLSSGEEVAVDSVLSQSEMMKEGYANAGIEVQKMEKVKVQFLGKERIGLKMEAMTEDVPYYTLQLFDYTAGKYSATLTFASYVEDKTEELLDLYYTLEEK